MAFVCCGSFRVCSHSVGAGSITVGPGTSLAVIDACGSLLKPGDSEFFLCPKVLGLLPWPSLRSAHRPTSVWADSPLSATSIAGAFTKAGQKAKQARRRQTPCVRDTTAVVLLRYCHQVPVGQGLAQLMTAHSWLCPGFPFLGFQLPVLCNPCLFSASRIRDSAADPT